MLAEPALRVHLDSQALVANWRWFAARAGVPMTAAIKADGYGLGAAGVVSQLAAAGCKCFAVSTWAEAEALADPSLPLLVLHGFVAADSAVARTLPRARPVLNTAAQIAQWRAAFPDRAADLMVDTGMNRLGIAATELALVDGLVIDTLHSHLACADDPAHPLTARQLARFRDLVAATPGMRHALANSAGICWGPDYAFDAVRPGLGLYGGKPHPDAVVRAVARPETRVVQVRDVPTGGQVGYGAAWTAERDSRIAIVNLGYADGIARMLAPHLVATAATATCPGAGRISMDLIAFDVTGADVAEGDWLALDFDLARLSHAGGISQYELLTSLSRRYQRLWT